MFAFKRRESVTRSSPATTIREKSFCGKASKYYECEEKSKENKDTHAKVKTYARESKEIELLREQLNDL